MVELDYKALPLAKLDYKAQQLAELDYRALPLVELDCSSVFLWVTGHLFYLLVPLLIIN